MTWGLGPFTRLPGAVVEPVAGLAWAAKDVFNPGGVVHDGRVCLLVRGEDEVGRYAGTSRIGLATSDDGERFTVEPDPVLAPGGDRWAPWEVEGGCEDPRVVEAPDGGFVCLYTGFDGKVGTLMVATSDDLRTWTKHGPAFAGTPQGRRSSKSGAVVTEVRDGRLVAARIDGRYWMYWGEGICFAATSDDLVRWTPVTFDATGDRYLTFDPDAPHGSWAVHRVPGLPVLRPLLHPRPGRWDSLLVEPGPPAVLTGDGIVLIANGANHWRAATRRCRRSPTPPARCCSTATSRARSWPGPPSRCSAPASTRPTGSWATSASPRPWCCSAARGASTSAWPTPASAAPPPAT